MLGTFAWGELGYRLLPTLLGLIIGAGSTPAGTSIVPEGKITGPGVPPSVGLLVL
jgi:hypothetical protein